jgi:hypothetical protein
MRPNRNPRWEQKRIEGYVIIHVSKKKPHILDFLEIVEGKKSIQVPVLCNAVIFLTQ